jgi:hypothetical protein
MVSGQKQSYVLLKTLSSSGTGLRFLDLVHAMKELSQKTFGDNLEYVNGPVPLTQLVDECQVLNEITFSKNEGFSITSRGRIELVSLEELDR